MFWWDCYPPKTPVAGLTQAPFEPGNIPPLNFTATNGV